MESVLFKLPHDYSDDFKRQKQSKTSELEEDMRFAETDSCSEVGDLKESGHNKFDDAESIIGFFGGDIPVGKGEHEHLKEESEDEYDGKEFFTEEEYEYEDQDDDSLVGIENLSVKGKSKDLDKTFEAQNKSPNLIETEFDKATLSFRYKQAPCLFENLINKFLEMEPDARSMLIENKLNTKWEIKKRDALRKKLGRAKQLKDEIQRNCDRILKTKIGEGVIKKMNGIISNVYVKDYLPSKPADTVQDALDDLFTDEENMELTLEEDGKQITANSETDCREADGELEFSDMDLDNTCSDNESDPEQKQVNTDNIEMTTKPTVNDEPSIAFGTTDPIFDPTRNVTMDLTDLDLPEKPQEDDDDDVQSTASDLDFYVSDEVKELQKLYKIPNDVLRMINAGDDTKLLQLLKDIEQNVDELDESFDQGNLEEEMELDENIDQRDEEDLERLDVNSLGSISDSEDEGEEDKENGSKVGTDRVPSKPNSILGDASSTTGSVLSEVQNRSQNPVTSVDQQPPPGPQVMFPSGETERKKIVLGCVGIPRDMLPYVKVVMVPTMDIIKAYQKFDSELCKLAQGPDGHINNEALITRLMQQAGANLGHVQSWGLE